jgi:hypothetical protein
MDRPIIKIVDVSTQTEIVREMNDEEYAQHLKDEASLQERIQKAAELENKKIEATAKLAALGLTSDDLKALGLGGN